MSQWMGQLQDTASTGDHDFPMSSVSQSNTEVTSSHMSSEMHNTTLPANDHSCHGENTTDPESDDEAIRRLKDLFENNAGILTEGHRDTIESIISKYENLRNEVKEDPRNSLALSMEFYDLSSHKRNGPIRSRSFHHYATDNGGAVWDFQEDTLLEDVYADLDESIFEDSVGAGVTLLQTTDSESTKTRNQVQQWLLGTANLSLSPIMEVVMIEPVSAAVVASTVEVPYTRWKDGRGVLHESSDGEAISGGCEGQESLLHPGFTTPIYNGSSPNILPGDKVNEDAMPRLLYKLEAHRQRVDTFETERVELTAHISQTDSRPDVKSDYVDFASNFLTIAGDTSNPEVVFQKTRHGVTDRTEVNNMGRKLQKLQKSSHIVANPSLFTHLEEDDATELILGAGIIVMLSVVAIAGYSS